MSQDTATAQPDTPVRALPSPPMSAHHGAWIRYGNPLTDDQVDFAIEHYQAAILQPWETAAAGRLKAARPDMTVLAYKCLSSTRSYESGPVLSSGVGFEEAEENGEDWFAHRLDGSRIAWARYPGHWQMAVWDEEYQQRWVDNVVEEFDGSPWDGVMADNDVYDDYYGLRPPIEGDRGMGELRAALDELVTRAGSALNGVGKILVPNIAESRRAPGRWAAHAAFGGGFEEVWLAYGAADYLDPMTSLAQMPELDGPGLSIMRIASDGTDTHRNFTYGLAAFWVFGGARTAVFTATAHDGYSGTPFIAQLSWDLGDPVADARQRGNGWSREFTGGWAAVNLNDNRRRKVTYPVPAGMVTVDGRPAPDRVSLDPHEGVLYRKDSAL